ncbi:diaminopimelate decarboxylase [Gulosibacter macacae]|uniref:Diaminopimelate decarboxylase n=1 Tax=Gulosibacter macacae TaxID=2488791 RepID=A0A3P3VVV9_9MICO|nr:diaminopimelate decarboxylase [Gulosibacter macacae]RRJ86820.1 diaminopimelate decarboxylase [Gulosibacter macacae]
MTTRRSLMNRLGHVLPATAEVTNGKLRIGGIAVSELVAEYGTPLHIYDEEALRAQMRSYVDGMRQRWPNSDVLFASKAAPLVAIYAIAAAEGMAIDIAGSGELELALAAGVDPERIYFHGNAKTDYELARAIEVGVHMIVVDSEDELDRLERLVPATHKQRLLLRVIPGVDAQTHASMNTGGSDSTFGLPPARVHELIEDLRDHDRLDVVGVHVHIGSQILNTGQFAEAVAALAPIGGLKVYDLGGGLGVAYHEHEIAPSVDEYLDALIAAARKHLPADAQLLIEPGRSTVARAGVTAYRVVVVKQTGKRFVAVDGGMADQLEVPLTGVRFDAILADRADEAPDTEVQLVGRQCESGDLLIDDARLPSPRVDDIVVMPVTGAYSYTMTNNYNGALRPAVVMVSNGKARLAARREEVADLLRLHEPAGGYDWRNPQLTASK